MADCPALSGAVQLFQKRDEGAHMNTRLRCPLRRIEAIRQRARLWRLAQPRPDSVSRHEALDLRLGYPQVSGYLVRTKPEPVE